MNPDMILAAQKRFGLRIREELRDAHYAASVASAAVKLAEAAIHMEQWLKGGGVLPTQWQPARAHLDESARDPFEEETMAQACADVQRLAVAGFAALIVQRHRAGEPVTPFLAMRLDQCMTRLHAHLERDRALPKGWASAGIGPHPPVR